MDGESSSSQASSVSRLMPACWEISTLVMRSPSPSRARAAISSLAWAARAWPRSRLARAAASPLAMRAMSACAMAGVYTGTQTCVELSICVYSQT